MNASGETSALAAAQAVAREHGVDCDEAVPDRRGQQRAGAPAALTGRGAGDDRHGRPARRPRAVAHARGRRRRLPGRADRPGRCADQPAAPGAAPQRRAVDDPVGLSWHTTSGHRRPSRGSSGVRCGSCTRRSPASRATWPR
jgi:hypothetical protein